MLTAEVKGLDRVRAKLASLGKQTKYAASRALNNTAFDVRAGIQQEMLRVFDRPKAYVVNSMWVGKKATRDSLEAWVWPRDRGGKGVLPEQVLRAEVLGGARRNTRFERALQKAGILPAGMAAVPATWLRESEHGDGHGGVKGSFIVRLLSYLNAFAEEGQGYRANMKDRGRKRLAKFGRTERGFKTIRGAVYFVSRGRGEFNGKQQHLHAGIWQKSGIHGSDVKPVFLFTRMPRYRVRLPLWTLAASIMRQQFPAHFRREIGHALATAR